MLMVKRYDIADDDDSGDVSMMEFEDGEYVTFAEYDALAARLAEAERIVNAVALVHKEAHLNGGRIVLTEGCALFLGAWQYRERNQATADSASVNHWQCLQCGWMNTEPYCPCTAEPDVTCATHGCTYRDGTCIRCWSRETVIGSHEKAIDSLLDDCVTVYGGPVQHDSCCLDYPRCDCNSPPEPDNAPAVTGLTQQDYDALVRDAMLWRTRSPTGAGGNARAFVCCEGVGQHAPGCIVWTSRRTDRETVTP